MQIVNNIRICCADCGMDMPIDIHIGREPQRNLWTFTVAPCPKCMPSLHQAALTKAVSLPKGQLPHEAGRYHTTWINGQVVVTPEGK